MEPPTQMSFDEIRERAYELWERNHRPEGFEIEFWLLAERELRSDAGGKPLNSASRDGEFTRSNASAAVKAEKV